jgi:AcrR family transcriptional regulator
MAHGKTRSREDRRSGTRRQAFLAAAQDVFLERGFAGTNLDEVIRRSGGSRATLYAQFGSKEGLFAAIIGELCQGIVGALAGAALTGTVRSALETFGLAYMQVLMTPGGLGLYRIVIAESSRSPDLGSAVYEAGPLAASEQLSDFLRSCVADGRLRLADPDLAARHFLEMVKGDLHFRALLGLGEPPTPTSLRRSIRHAVDVFLAGTLARPED